MNATLSESKPETSATPVPAEPSARRGSRKLFLLVGILGVAGLLTAGIAPRLSRDAKAVESRPAMTEVEASLLERRGLPADGDQCADRDGRPRGGGEDERCRDQQRADGKPDCDIAHDEQCDSAAASPRQAAPPDMLQG